MIVAVLLAAAGSTGFAAPEQRHPAPPIPLQQVLDDSDRAWIDAMAHYAAAVDAILRPGPTADEAARHLFSAVQCAPDSEFLLRELIGLWTRSPDHDEDQRILDNLAPLANTHPEAVPLNLLVANAHMRAGRFDAAEPILQRLFDRHRWSSVPIVRELAVFYWQTGRVRDGARLLENATRPDRLRHNFTIEALAARFYDTLLQPDQCPLPDRTRAQYRRRAYRHALRAASAASPDQVDTVIHLALMLLRADLPEDAAAILRALPRPTPESAALLATCYEHQGMLTEAIATWTERTRQEPFDPTAYRHLARLQLRRGKRAAALDALEKAYRLTLDPSVAARILQLAAELKRYDTVIRYADHLPPSPQLLIHTARAHYARRDVDATLSDLDRAEALADRARTPLPDDQEAQLQLLRGLAHRANGNLPAAVRALTRTVRLTPKNRHARRLLAILHEAAGNHPEALTLWTELLPDATPSRAADIHQRLARLYLSLQRPHPALRHAREAYRIKPDQERLVQLVHCLLANGHAEKALARAQDITHSQTRMLARARCLARLRRHDQAIRILEQLLAQARERRQTPDPRFYYLVASTYHALDQSENAIKTLQKAVAIAPRDPVIANFLGYHLAERGQDLDEAERLVRIAIAADPESAAYWDSLAWVRYRQDRHQEAIEAIDKAIRLAPDPGPVLLDHAGDIYHAAGHSGRAAEFWRRALRVARPDHEPDIRSKLDRLGQIPTAPNTGNPTAP